MDFKGDAGSCVCVRVSSYNNPRYLGIIGYGEKETIDSAAAVAAAAAAAIKERPKARSIGLFKGTASKTTTTPQVERLTLFTIDKERTQKALEAALRVASGVHIARQLVNAPANYCTTVTLAKAAEAIAKEGGLECRILNKEEIEELGMGCYLAVAKGSMYPPLFIHLIYRSKDCPPAAAAAAAPAAAAAAPAAAGAPTTAATAAAAAAGAAGGGGGDREEGDQSSDPSYNSGSPGGTTAAATPSAAAAAAAAGAAGGGEKKIKKIALIGKGLTFDSGGYNVKRAETSIEMMKFDMSGAAAVLGAAAAVAAAAPIGCIEVHFLAAAAENMISQSAYRPGDIIQSSNGITIEVGNTDAEGRLTLADTLVYAEETLHADIIIDIATLTGACIVALGDTYAGLFSPDDQLAQQILQWYTL
ncbi:cytosol aminopeptidase, putative [Eimeria maxima]|uniref:Cytosol aminopeptidase, putative n=1 Tax=Eimeria maxima TaxID=5804 RepID=U6M6J0_EIMMA|nr:cytosol aminopeptidase, putative [Eimeria maxima]CDJ58683.1 cytosol aminopeptidase, putative [Eimeria maxima]